MLLYIHIPFCDSKCFYCAFNSYTYLHNLKQDYITALQKQLKYELSKHNPRISTIFIGGGTPSVLEPKFYCEILEIVSKYLINKPQITIEANPNSATKKWLDGISHSLINRISFGVQSFDNEKLKFLGRNHTKKQAINSIKYAYQIGFENINIDIIYDTKLDTKELLQNDLNIIKDLNINHISTYSLTIEENTKFSFYPEAKKENLRLTKFLFQNLAELGFKQYEISNFAKTNSAKSYHNLGYWNYQEYSGIGSGAVGFINNTRYYPNKNIIEYIKNPLQYKIEKLTNQDMIFEKIFLGLRSQVGVDIDLLCNKTTQINQLITENKVKQINNKIYCTDYLLADEIALYLT